MRPFLLSAALAWTALPCAAAEWAWPGGTAATGAVITSSVGDDMVLADGGWPGIAVRADRAADAGDGIRRWTWDRLHPDTAYAWGRSGATAPLGVLRTLPEPGRPASFRIAVGSCAKGADIPAWRAIAGERPLLTLVTGDFHYGDVDTDDAPRIRTLVLARPLAPSFQVLAAVSPVLWMWDDHDFGGNDSRFDSKAATAVHAVYRQAAPHLPLALPGDGAPIAQAFSVGRVRFLWPDLRSDRDRTPGSLLGERQRSWIAAEIAAAPVAHRLLVLVSSVPWNGGPLPGKDRWQSYPEERSWLVERIAAAGIRACILAGDAHMVAIDDGRTSPGALPVLQAAALDQRGSYKGGPYSHGARPGGGQYALMEVEDDGGALTVRWAARDGSDGRPGIPVAPSATWPAAAPGPIAYTFTVP
ncbi:MAG: hypothetical protein RLZZ127_3303 [Planctomycetota bacterium]|jgi:hypothetical protein